MRNKILSLLVLLVAATGAWAETVFELNGSAASTGTLTLGTTGISTATVKIHSNGLTVNAIKMGNDYVYANGQYFTIKPESGSFKKGDKLSIAICYSNDGIPEYAKAVIYAADHETLLYTTNDAINGRTSADDPVVEEYVLTQDADLLYIGRYSKTAIYVTTLKVERSGVDVTTNAETEGALFTEASFTMPAFDATVEYEALRDMSVQMPVVVGDGQDGYRLRIKKNDQGQFGPADMSFDDMLALFTVTDEIEQNSLTFFGQTVDCNLSIFAVDDNDQPTGNALGFEALVPGRYVVMAAAADGSDYFGETGYSNIFELYQGYEVTVPAGEFVTYYKDEALTLYDDEAQLYTITAVSETTATATPFDVIPANVPLLLKNNSSETRTILLIPTEDPLAFMHYSGFVGSLDPTTIAASTETQTNYACNGKDFVYVKNAISAAANKAWLSIPSQQTPGARQLKIVFSDATRIGSIDNGKLKIENWYDLNGRKLSAKPTKKGVYIKDGKKAVIK